MKRKIWFLMAVMLIPAFIITSCSKDSEEEETPTNTAPTAAFSVTPDSANINVYFDLDASACSDPETPVDALEVRWDFDNDGSWDTEYSTLKTIGVSYDAAGSYTIHLEVKDGGGLTGTTTKQVTVTSGGGGNLPPDPAANPNPEDGAVDMIILVGLQWTASDPDQDPLTFDVYFSTSPNPEKVADGIGTNSYEPGTLEYNTTYYWMIKTRDDHDHVTTGPVWSFTTGSHVFACGDDITDPRDGKVYGTVAIGEQCWMSQNMNVGMRIDGNQDMSNDGSIEKYCYDDNEANCDEFGAIYQWDEMMQYDSDVDGICPEGWHLPALEEWEALEIALGMPEDQATATSGWQGTYEGNALKQGGSTGFNALMGGNRSTSGSFTLGGLATAFWTATQSTTYNARARTLDNEHGAINHTNYNKEYGHAVRCLKD